MSKRTTAYRHLTSNKDLRDVLRRAARAGCTFKQTRNGHVTVYPPNPNQPPVVTGSSPSDHRSIKNFVSHLRRSGVRL